MGCVEAPRRGCAIFTELQHQCLLRDRAALRDTSASAAPPPPPHRYPPPPLHSYNYGKRYELSAYPSGGGPGYGNIADYVYSLGLAAIVLLVLSAVIGFLALGEALNMFVIYLWARRHPEEQASIWFFTFPGAYLPWALVAWNFATDQDPVPGLAGIAVAHTYYYMIDVLPRGDGPLRHANKWLQTPDWVYRIFNVGPTGVAAQVQGGARRAPGGAPPPPPARHVWGGGQALGGGDRPHRD